MGSVVARMAFAAWAGVFSVYLALQLAGMAFEARSVLGFAFLFNGIQLGALLYDRKHGGDEDAE